MYDVCYCHQSSTVILLTHSTSRSSESLSATSTRRPARRTGRRCRPLVDEARWRSAKPPGDVLTPVSGPPRTTSGVNVSTRYVMSFCFTPDSVRVQHLVRQFCLSVCLSVHALMSLSKWLNMSSYMSVAIWFSYYDVSKTMQKNIITNEQGHD